MDAVRRARLRAHPAGVEHSLGGRPELRAAGTVRLWRQPGLRAAGRWRHLLRAARRHVCRLRSRAARRTQPGEEHQPARSLRRPHHVGDSERGGRQGARRGRPAGER